jgi:hypothetical protein
MRKLVITVLGAMALAAFSAVGPVSAGPYDFPWCAQGIEAGYPGDCSYRTYAQCQASVSGRLLSCGPNPQAAVARPPVRRSRKVQSY